MTDRFRPDLEGLRGVAVALVVLFHARVSMFSGGFIGVDAFFVLSGFLITGLLVREHSERGRIELSAFYARRARRILPAATAAIVVTLAGAAVAVAPLDLPPVALDAGAAALFVGNLRFAVAATDYFAAATPSPLLHFWSLGVEEQFYLIWPGLLLLAGRLHRHGPALLVGAIFAGSLALSIVLTPTYAAWAFYGLPTRAWQLALGGLLAVHSARIARLPDGLLAPLGWVGLAALLGASAALDPSAPYPGLTGLLPAVAVALLIATSGRHGGPTALLALSPVRALGRISFSVYLYHWPLLTLPEIATGTELPTEARLGLAALSVPLGALSWRFVEEPFRRTPRLARRPRRALALAGSAALAVALLAVGVGAASEAALAASISARPAADPKTASGAPADAPSADAFPYPSAAPASSPVPSTRPTPAVVVAATGSLPTDIRPRLADARGDGDGLNRRGCGLSLYGERPPICRLGATDAPITVALVGDSHAAQWFPALELVARERGWAIVPLTKDSCIFLDLRIISVHLQREYVECARWRERVVDELAVIRPQLVIVSSSRWVHPVDPADADPERHGRAMARLTARLAGRLVILPDTPLMSEDVPACLSRHPKEISRCTTTREEALSGHYLVRDRLAAQLTGALLVDPTDWLCTDSVCPAVIDGMIVYQDDHHLTATFARSLASRLAAALPETLVPPTATADGP